MDSLVQLGQQYKSEFEDKYEGIRRRGVQHFQEAQDKIQQIQPELQSKQEEFVTLLQDTSPVQQGYAPLLLITFSWTSVLLLASYVTSLITGFFLEKLLGLFIGSATAFLLAYIVLPLAFFIHVDFNNNNNVPTIVPTHTDSEIRFELLAFAAIEGVLTGFLFSERYLATMQPLAFVTPLLIAIIGRLVEEKVGTARVAILGSTVGVSLVFHLFFGIVTGQLSFAYTLLVLCYTIISLSAVQYSLKDGDYNQVKAYGCMFGYFVATIYVQMVVFVIFGGDKSVQSSD